MTVRLLRPFTVAALVAALVAGCGTTASPSPSPATAGPLPSASAATSPTAAPTATPAPTPASSAVLIPPRIGLHEVVKGLDSPVDVAAEGGAADRLFVVEQPGRIRVVKNGVLAPQPFLDISGRISSGGERGLLGLALHPDFPNDPRFFVDYTDKDGNTVVSSFEQSLDADS